MSIYAGNLNYPPLYIFSVLDRFRQSELKVFACQPSILAEILK